MRLTNCYCFISVLLVLGLASCSRGRSDEAIARQIRAKFAADPYLKTAGLSVSVEDGEVTLRGRASSIDIELQAYEFAKTTAGVRKLHDEIVVPEANEAPQPAAIALPLPMAASVSPAAESDYVPSFPPPPDDVQFARVPEPTPEASAISDPPPPAPLVDRNPAPEVIAPPPAASPSDQPQPSQEPPRDRSHTIALAAAGSAIPAPLYTKWFSTFHSDNPNVEIRYQALGSSGGIKQLMNETVDFAATDFAMTNDQLAQKRVLHFPSAIMGAAIICNLGNGGIQDVRLSGEVLAGIYLGKIRRWDHQSIKALNPSTYLPSNEIITVHRSDGSGPTYWFTEYLSSVSPEWKASVGASAAVSWPVAGLGGKGDEGVVNVVQHTRFSIGYVEAHFAMENQIGSPILNRSGRFVKPTPQALTAAAKGAVAQPDFRYSISNAPDRQAYPIASFTWLLVAEQIPDHHKRGAIRSFLEWMLTQGNSDSEGLQFAPLPRELIAKEQSQIGRIR